MLGKILFGLQVAAIGLAIVFAVLILLITLIWLITKLIQKVTERKVPEKVAPETSLWAEPTVMPEAELAVGAEVNDAELIAVIAAALAAFDDSGKQLVIRKVRRVSGWNKSSRQEQVYHF